MKNQKKKPLGGGKKKKRKEGGKKKERTAAQEPQSPRHARGKLGQKKGRAFMKEFTPEQKGACEKKARARGKKKKKNRQWVWKPEPDHFPRGTKTKKGKQPDEEKMLQKTKKKTKP